VHRSKITEAVEVSVLEDVRRSNNAITYFDARGGKKMSDQSVLDCFCYRCTSVIDLQLVIDTADMFINGMHTPK
jgi:hypothetical protein